MTVGGASPERLREIDLVDVGMQGCVEEVRVPPTPPPTSSSLSRAGNVQRMQSEVLLATRVSHCANCQAK